MTNFIQNHEQAVLRLLESSPEQEKLSRLLTDHDKKILWMQHERLAHLIVLMFVCLFFFLTFGFTMIYFMLPCILLTSLLLLLTIAYLVHYYRLENSVQRWYLLSDRIRMAGEQRK